MQDSIKKIQDQPYGQTEVKRSNAVVGTIAGGLVVLEEVARRRHGR